MEVGLAFDLRADLVVRAGQPEDSLEEYDSEDTVRGLEAALAAAGHRTRRLGGGRAFLSAVLERPPELVFNIAEGRGGRGREAQVPAVLELLGIPFTHSDAVTCALTLDKALAKRVAAAAGVPTPAFAVLESADPGALERLPLHFPVLAKPVGEGSSMGIRRDSRAEDREALLRQLERLAGYRQPVLVEEFCPGPEFTVGVLGTGSGARAIGVMEIVPRLVPLERFVYSLEVKHNWREEVRYDVPPQRPAELVSRLASVAVAAHRALGCRDVSRVDMRLDSHGEPAFLEVNPLPGLNAVTGDLVILARGSGLSYEALVAAIVDEALARQQP